MTNKKQTPKRDKEQDKMKKAAEQIEVILLKNNLALFPFIHFNPSNGAQTPQVRLISTNNIKDNAIETTDTGEVGDSEVTDGAVEPEQA